MSVDNERPPYVTFERRAVEDRSKSIGEGLYGSKDVDFAIVMRPGSRDTFEQEAAIWISGLKAKAKTGQIPQTWADGFAASYKSWLAGEVAPENGTPIKGWPVLSPAAQKDLIASGIRTVEDLAQLPETEFGAIGTGALSFKQKAQAWLDSAKDHGKVAEQLNALLIQVTALTDLTRAQAAEIDNLRKLVPKEAAQNPLIKA